MCVLYCTILYCTVLYYTILYCTVLYYTVLYCTVLYCTLLYYTILYCTILYYTVLYCTVYCPLVLSIIASCTSFTTLVIMWHYYLAVMTFSGVTDLPRYCRRITRRIWFRQRKRHNDNHSIIMVQVWIKRLPKATIIILADLQ